MFTFYFLVQKCIMRIKLIHSNRYHAKSIYNCSVIVLQCNIGFFNSTGSSICIIYTYYNGGAPGGSEIFPKFNKRGESEKNRKINKRLPRLLGT